MRDELDTTSYWTDTESIPGYPALDRDLDVDAVVVGAGLTGLTAAYLLQRSGRRSPSWSACALAASIRWRRRRM